jgi:hypothetical protein
MKYKVAYWEEVGRVSMIEAQSQKVAERKALQMLDDGTAPDGDITHRNTEIV